VGQVRASLGAIAVVATTKAQRRWWRDLNERFAALPITYVEIIEAITDDLRLAATEHEIKRRGSGLDYLLKVLKDLMMGGVKSLAASPSLTGGARTQGFFSSSEEFQSGARARFTQRQDFLRLRGFGRGIIFQMGVGGSLFSENAIADRWVKAKNSGAKLAENFFLRASQATKNSPLEKLSRNSGWGRGYAPESIGLMVATVSPQPRMLAPPIISATRFFRGPT